MKPIQVLLRDHAGPLLRDHGFHRSGGNFRHVATNGDVAIVSIRSWRLMQAELEFWVEMGLVTRVTLDYRTYRGEDVRPERVQFTDTYDTWSTRMRDPARTFSDGNDVGQFNLDDEGTMQRFLTTLDASATDLIALTDRPALIEALRHPAPGVQMQTPSAWSLALVMADQGRWPDLDRLLEELRETDPKRGSGDLVGGSGKQPKVTAGKPARRTASAAELSLICRDPGVRTNRGSRRRAWVEASTTLVRCTTGPVPVRFAARFHPLPERCLLPDPNGVAAYG